MPEAVKDFLYGVWARVMRCFHWCGGMSPFRTGLNWTDVKNLLDMYKIKLGPNLMTWLQVAEEATLQCDYEAMQKQHK